MNLRYARAWLAGTLPPRYVERNGELYEADWRKYAGWGPLDYGNAWGFWVWKWTVPLWRRKGK